MLVVNSDNSKTNIGGCNIELGACGAMVYEEYHILGTLVVKLRIYMDI